MKLPEPEPVVAIEALGDSRHLTEARHLAKNNPAAVANIMREGQRRRPDGPGPAQ